MRATLSLLITIIVTAAVFGDGGTAIVPPGQPKTGPGGTDYTHKKVVESTFGADADQFWLFEPAAPKPKTAPVVVFNHGWAAMTPKFYRGWIEHIVKRGNVVIFPRYQADLTSQPESFTPKAIGAVKAALTVLKTGTHVRPELNKVALVGHSMGGIISANMAALAKKEGLPAFKAVMLVEPGGARSVLEDLSKIPAGTLLLSTAAEDDWVVGVGVAKEIFAKATSVGKADRNLVILHTDRRGDRTLVAGHMAPVQGYQDALSWYGFWKWFDALCDTAFDGKNRKYCLGNTPEQRFLGTWSDGTAVKEPTITVVN